MYINPIKEDSHIEFVEARVQAESAVRAEAGAEK